MGFRMREGHDHFEIEVSSVPDRRIQLGTGLAMGISVGGLLVALTDLYVSALARVPMFLLGMLMEGEKKVTARLDLLGLTLVDGSGAIRVRWQEMSWVKRTPFGIMVQTDKGRFLVGEGWPEAAVDELCNVLHPAWESLQGAPAGDSPPEALLRLLSSGRRP